jgi:hypothetical protein
VGEKRTTPRNTTNSEKNNVKQSNNKATQRYVRFQQELKSDKETAIDYQLEDEARNAWLEDQRERREAQEATREIWLNERNNR